MNGSCQFKNCCNNADPSKNRCEKYPKHYAYSITLFSASLAASANQVLIHNHLLKMPVLAKSINADLSRGFTVAQVAEKHGWTNRARYGNTVGLRKAVLKQSLVATVARNS